MKIYYDILLIATIYVFGLDISGFWQALSSAIKRWLTGGRMSRPFELKPFSCSLCMTFWTGLLYLLLTHHLTIANAAFVCLVAMLTPRIKDLLLVVDGLLAKVFKTIFMKI